MTQGTATFSRKFYEYGKVPPDIQKRVIEETLAEEEES